MKVPDRFRIKTFTAPKKGTYSVTIEDMEKVVQRVRAAGNHQHKFIYRYEIVEEITDEHD